jgi:4-amino-4-deoxy-L-arabinose transferase-like glycosyltransferase
MNDLTVAVATTNARTISRQSWHSAFTAVLLLFVVALGSQWSGVGSIVVSDVGAYLVGGVHLIRDGAFVDAFGRPEVWFPPLFPLLIGIGSLGGRFDPLLIGRLIAACSSLATLALVWRIGVTRFRSYWAALAAVVVLASNATFQQLASESLSQPFATLMQTVALLAWLAMPPHRGRLRAAVLGAAVGLGYLTRPEIALMIGLLAVADVCLQRPVNLRRVCAEYALAFAMFAICAAPYVLYLRAHTGRLVLSNKGDVNVAAGRSEYYRMPREYIDPATLTMTFAPYPLTTQTEAARYGHNLLSIGAAYSSIFRLPLGIPLLLLAALGVRVLARTDRRLLSGLLLQFGYLPLLAWYAVNESYLHATLPAIALLAGAGVGLVHRRFLGALRRAEWWTAVALLAGFSWLALGLGEQATRGWRWLQASPDGSLKAAGERLKELGVRDGTVLEIGGTVSYYSGLRRGRLTPNDATTVTAYAFKTYTGPVYLALDSLHRDAYHPTIARLLDDPGNLHVVTSYGASGVHAIVLRLR